MFSGPARRASVALVSALALGACAAPGPAPGTPAAPARRPAPAPNALVWQSELGRDHPLVGRIWSRGRWLSEAELIGEARRARYVLLGEKHDNRDHHALQARLVEAVAAAGRKPTVVWEMIEAEQQAELDAFLAARPGDDAGLGAALRWQERGWPAWSIYRPVAAAALRLGLPMVGADLSRPRARAIAKGGLSAIDPSRVRDFGLDRPLAPALEASLRDELVASHCGMLPEPALAPMALAQRARDAEFAARLLESDRGGGALLVAGAGHVRVDRGVPAALGVRAPGARAFSVAFVEVAPDRLDPADYAAAHFAPAPPFDALWFTPALASEDPCAGMGPKREGGAGTRAGAAPLSRP